MRLGAVQSHDGDPVDRVGRNENPEVEAHHGNANRYHLAQRPQVEDAKGGGGAERRLRPSMTNTWQRSMLLWVTGLGERDAAAQLTNNAWSKM